jgi:choline dehydrogenase-like flavoprotein
VVVTEAAPLPPGGGEWDVVVIGTGLGGATLGHALARAGRSVLFLEKGHDEVARGVPGGEALEDPAARMDVAYWPDRMAATIDGRASAPFPFAGCAVGGSSLLYAAGLERFARSDVEAVPGLPHPTGGWPIGWDDLCRHYAAAERLYRVAGTHDPLSEDAGEALRVPPPLSTTDAQFMAAFGHAGLHPYRLHVGLGQRPDCNGCGGRVCPFACKSDARAICLEPALDHEAVTLLADSDVVRIEADRRRATGVIYRQGGRLYRARGRTVVLAAGALRSPALLLASHSADWPNGLANGSDQVGRNLMFHANEWFAIWSGGRADARGAGKSIGFRDLATHQGVRLGSVQSSGMAADAFNIRGFLHRRLEASRWRRLPGLGPLLWGVSQVAERLFGAATIFVMIVEDLPYPDNRVLLHPDDPGRIVVQYGIRDELRERTRAARGLVRRALRNLRVLPLQADVELNFGHPCGTCRAGHDPATSVTDAEGKAHGLDDLYVADASFMPSSGGTNPGLTVIAQSLRVAGAIRRRLEGGAMGPVAARAETTRPFSA